MELTRLRPPASANQRPHPADSAYGTQGSIGSAEHDALYFGSGSCIVQSAVTCTNAGEGVFYARLSYGLDALARPSHYCAPLVKLPDPHLLNPASRFCGCTSADCLLCAGGARTVERGTACWGQCAARQEPNAHVCGAGQPHSRQPCVRLHLGGGAIGFVRRTLRERSTFRGGGEAEPELCCAHSDRVGGSAGTLPSL